MSASRQRIEHEHVLDQAPAGTVIRGADGYVYEASDDAGPGRPVWYRPGSTVAETSRTVDLPTEVLAAPKGTYFVHAGAEDATVVVIGTFDGTEASAEAMRSLASVQAQRYRVHGDPYSDPPRASVCGDCGCLVGDADQHDRWHIGVGVEVNRVPDDAPHTVTDPVASVHAYIEVVPEEVLADQDALERFVAERKYRMRTLAEAEGLTLVGEVTVTISRDADSVDSTGIGGERRVVQANAYSTLRLEVAIGRPAQEWITALGHGQVLDWDGWSDQDASVPVSRAEFERRYAQCTVRPVRS